MIHHRIIVNPAANRGGGERAIPAIEALLSQNRIDYDLVRTERPWHAAELAEEAAAAGVDCVVAAGGDGTANEVLNGLMRAKQAGAEPGAMGVLCVGRGNDLAYGMGIPAGLEEGCRALAAGRRRMVDVGRVAGGLYPQGRYFGNGVGIGFDAVVGFVAAKMTHLTGLPLYLVAALRTLYVYYHAPLVTIEQENGTETITQPALMISVMNGRRMGGGFMMAPHGEPDDGLFDLCIARQVSRGRVLALIPQFMRGTQTSHEAVRNGRARRVVVTALEGVLPAHADGETLCVEGQRLELELLPRQIEVVTAAGEGA